MVTRLANKLQTDLWDRFSGLKEGQAMMRAQCVLTTVLPDLLPSQDCSVLAPQSSPFHFKHKAINKYLQQCGRKQLLDQEKPAVTKPICSEGSTISTLLFSLWQSLYLSLLLQGISWSLSQESNPIGFVRTQYIYWFGPSYVCETRRGFSGWSWLKRQELDTSGLPFHCNPWLWTLAWLLFILEPFSSHLSSEQCVSFWKEFFRP